MQGSLDNTLELAKLDREIHDLNEAQAKCNRDYDRAPDGSQAKRDALTRMTKLGDQLREKWARVDELVDEL